MQYQEKFYRGDVLGTKTCTLNAETYNDLRRLINRYDNSPQVFVPVRSVQYMAVVSAEEVLFVDLHIQRVTELSWSGFQSSARGGLDSPVTYNCVWHNSKAHDCMQTISDEFAESLRALLNKMRDRERSRKATLLRFPLAS